MVLLALLGLAAEGVSVGGMLVPALTDVRSAECTVVAVQQVEGTGGMVCSATVDVDSIALRKDGILLDGVPGLSTLSVA